MTNRNSIQSCNFELKFITFFLLKFMFVKIFSVSTNILQSRPIIKGLCKLVMKKSFHKLGTQRILEKCVSYKCFIKKKTARAIILDSLKWTFHRCYALVPDQDFCVNLFNNIFFLKGYREIVGTLHKTFEDTCELCKPGTFGAFSDRSKCEKCRAGVICLTGIIPSFFFLLLLLPLYTV